MSDAAAAAAAAAVGLVCNVMSCLYSSYISALEQPWKHPEIANFHQAAILNFIESDISCRNDFL